eukprot:gene13618-15032_t
MYQGYLEDKSRCLKEYDEVILDSLFDEDADEETVQLCRLKKGAKKAKKKICRIKLRPRKDQRTAEEEDGGARRLLGPRASHVTRWRVGRMCRFIRPHVPSNNTTPTSGESAASMSTMTSSTSGESESGGSVSEMVGEAAPERNSFTTMTRHVSEYTRVKKRSKKEHVGCALLWAKVFFSQFVQDEFFSMMGGNFADDVGVFSFVWAEFVE